MKTSAIYTMHSMAAMGLGIPDCPPLLPPTPKSDKPNPGSRFFKKEVGTVEGGQQRARNLPCVCGSGLKFKRCCAQIARDGKMVDASTLFQTNGR